MNYLKAPDKVKYLYTIQKADFEWAADAVNILPPQSLPEIAFLGRSNVGKSSLINSFCERKGLARTSRTPGRTQALNFFRIKFKDLSSASPDSASARDTSLKQQFFSFECFFVDLPGFGYAEVSKKKKAGWKDLIGDYLVSRQALECVLLLIDSRREPAEEEKAISALGKNGNYWVLLTKADKLPKSEREKTRGRISKQLRIPLEQVQLVSSAKPELGDPRKVRDAVLSKVFSRPR